jgi:hypothetical protein
VLFIQRAETRAFELGCRCETAVVGDDAERIDRAMPAVGKPLP